MFDLVWRLNALPRQLPIHLLVRHLALNQASVEGEELRVMLDQLQSHLEVESLIAQLLVLLSDRSNEEEVLQADFTAFFQVDETVVGDATDDLSVTH